MEPIKRYTPRIRTNEFGLRWVEFIEESEGDMAFYADHEAKVRELDEQLTILKAQRIKYGPICLVCGAAEPCHLKDDPHSPCTFDPAPRELWDRCQEQKQRVSELEERLGAVEAGRECVHIDEYQALQDRVHELEATLRQVEEGHTCADEIHQRICEKLDSEQWREGNRVLASWEVVQRIMQERDQLRARVGELEALNHKLNKALVFAEHGRTLERLQDSETQRALEGKEEYGRRDG